MEWSVIFNLIDPKLFVVVAVCWVLGIMLKKTPRVADWSIVYVVTLFAVGLTIWILGFSSESVIQGILCGAFAVYGNQLVKQARKGVDQQ
ncbi:phage holin family protein [Paenibacillus sp. FA6]|uniref:phage holin family protein n=1 Tax=Paenibacillus sp. FA6 TaxID=3413029 RepID=UPI003F65F148